MTRISTHKGDNYLKQTLQEILEDGDLDKDPRPRYEDGEPAHSKFITQQVFQYDISKGEFPIITLRTTPFKAAWHDIEAIYIKQTNILEEMHPSIHSWWKPWVNSIFAADGLIDEKGEFYSLRSSSLGKTYAATIRRYDLMNNLLKSLEGNPFSRRHSINLNQEQQKIDDPKALQPCAFETLWAVREPVETIRFLDAALIQRSQDTAITFGINALQYLYLAMMVANHLTFKTGIRHEVGKFTHFVNNSHLYLRHESVAKEILNRESIDGEIKVELTCEPKDFYEHTFEDFKITVPKGIQKLGSKLELAI